MQLGIFAKTFQGREPRAILQAARDAGYRVVQYNMACSGLPSMPEDYSRRARPKPWRPPLRHRACGLLPCRRPTT